MKPAYFKILSAFVVVLFAMAIIGIKDLKLDYDFEKFFPSNDSDLIFYQNFRNQFESDNDFILIGIEAKNGIYNTLFLSKIDSLSQKIKRVKYITEVYAPTNLSYPVIGPMGGISKIPYLHAYLPSRLPKDSILIAKHQELLNTLFSSTSSCVSIYAKTQSGLSKVRSDAVLKEVNYAINQVGFNTKKIHLAGRIVSQKYMIDKMQNELLLFMTLSFFILLIVLWLLFRSKFGLIIPIVIVFLTVFILMGVLGFFKQSLNILSTLLPTIIFVVGVSDVIHIFSKYIHEINIGTPKELALKITLKETGWATFFTSITTAIGFFTLALSGIIPIQEFGIYTTFGVVLAFLLTIVIVPWVLPKIPIQKIKNGAVNQIKWRLFLNRLLLWVLHHQKKIMVSSWVFVAIGIYGISFLKIDNYLLEDLRDSDSHKKDFTFFENNFTSVRPYELAIEVLQPSTTVFNWDVLQELNKIEEQLKSIYNLESIASPLSIVKGVNMATNGGKIEYYKLPKTPQQLKKINRYLSKIKNQKKYNKLVSKGQTKARLSARMRDIGGYQMKLKNKEFMNFVTENINPKLIKVKITGTANLIDKNNDILTINMLQGLGIAFMAIGLIMGLKYRSFKPVFISLIVNIIPLLVIAGLMGYLGIEIRISTSIVFTIAFGIAVDDTIHFISRFYLELQKTKSTLWALKNTYLSTGKAIIVTSLILYAGFFSLVLSSFMTTFYIGLLISFTLIFAVITDMILLPVLCLKFFKD